MKIKKHFFYYVKVQPCLQLPVDRVGHLVPVDEAEDGGDDGEDGEGEGHHAHGDPSHPEGDAATAPL